MKQCSKFLTNQFGISGAGQSVTALIPPAPDFLPSFSYNYDMKELSWGPYTIFSRLLKMNIIPD